MSYWVNIHHPPPQGESQSCYVYLQYKNKQLKDEFNKGDLVFIYETENPREVVVEDEDGRRELKLQEGRKGVIALVRITSNFKPHRWEWHDIPFIGHFETDKVDVRRKFVPLQEINKARLREGLSYFNPRINGGLRKLKDEEFSIMARLIGFEEAPVQASLGILKDKGFTFQDFLKERQREREKEIGRESKGI